MSPRIVLFGHPLHQSLSPAMQEAAMAAVGIDGTYELADVAPADLGKGLESVRDGSFLGCNVTMPYKEVVLGLLDGLDADASIIGAVNTVTRDGTSLVGHNTDTYGVRRTVEALWEGADPAGSTAVIVGAGATGRSVTYAVLGLGFARIVVLNRHLERAQRLVADFKPLRSDAQLVAAPLRSDGLAAEIATADLVVNASSVGLNSDRSPLPAGIVQAHSRVLDVVYSPRETRLLREAREAGATAAVNGEMMVVHQGARAFELWFGRRAPVDVMQSALATAIAARSRAGAPPSNTR